MYAGKSVGKYIFTHTHGFMVFVAAFMEMQHARRCRFQCDYGFPSPVACDDGLELRPPAPGRGPLTQDLVCFQAST